MKEDRRWEKPWEVNILDDFRNGDGTLPLWASLFLPIVAPLMYLIVYYCVRNRVKRGR
jgi:hypothetical protein